MLASISFFTHNYFIVFSAQCTLHLLSVHDRATYCSIDIAYTPYSIYQHLYTQLTMLQNM